eukprot:m.4997 g.4997  ORF g.4997 m.4997 type:complete len:952 (-) comp3158_c0_seq1:126-2981(-)
MEKPTLEQVAQAVSITYTTASDERSRRDASKWLENFQRSVHAWEIADACLHKKISTELSFFAAQTIRLKIQSYFPELPPETHTQLRNSVLENLKSFTGPESRAISTQLALAVADLAVQMMPGWLQPLQDLIQMLSVSKATIGTLLDILKELPEEIWNRFMAVTEEHREGVSQQLGFDSAAVYPFLQKCVDGLSSETTVMSKVFLCLASWLKFGGEGSKMFVQMPLLQNCFDALASQDGDLQDAASQAIIQAVRLSRDTQHHGPLREALIPRILALQQQFEDSVRKEDVEIARMIAEIFGYLGDSLVPALLQEMSPSSMGILDLMLKLSSQPFLEVLQLTFHFWYLLADEIDALYTDHRDHYEKARAAIGPYYTTFLTHLAHHIKCPSDTTEFLDRKSEVGDIRDRIFDDHYPQSPMGLMSETAFIIGSAKCAEHFWGLCQQGDQSWNNLEANLFMMMTIARQIPDAAEIGGGIASAVVSVTEGSHVQLRHTAVRLAGELAPWSLAHPEYVPQLFSFVARHLQPGFTNVAISGVSTLCSECGPHMGSCFQDLVQLVVRANEFRIKRKDQITMIKSCAKVVSNMKTVPEIKAGMGQLCQPLLVALQTALQKDEKAVTSALHGLAEAFAYCNVKKSVYSQGAGMEHPIWMYAEQTCAGVRASMQKFPASEDVCEDGNRCYKYIFRNLGLDAAPLLQDTVGQVMSIYQERRHASCLYVAGKLIQVFGKVPAYTQPFFEMFSSMSATTFMFLSTDLEVLRQYPSHVEDYCNLSLEVVRAHPTMFAQPDASGISIGDKVFQLGVAALRLQHRDTHESATDLMKLIIGCYRFDGTPEDQRDLVKQLALKCLQSYGQELTNSLMLGVAGGLPPHFLPNIADVFWEVHLLAMSECAAWVQASLSLPALAAGRATDEHKRIFLNHFQRDLNATGTGLKGFREDVLKPFSRLYQPVKLFDVD